MKRLIKGMIDVSGKKPTKRRACASSKIILGAEAYKVLKEKSSPKGDVLEAARFAAIMAAKNTSGTIPLCHPLSINQVLVDFQCDDIEASVTSTVEVSFEGKTGVEMEALLGASIASLTIYDMLKFSDKSMVVDRTCLLEKTGGKSGDFKR